METKLCWKGLIVVITLWFGLPALYEGFSIKAFYERTLLWMVRFLCVMAKRHNPIKR